jgi:homocitrate synthase
VARSVPISTKLILSGRSQFANAFFDTETKMKIAQALSDFGVEYIELTSPAASEQSRQDCIKICNMGLKSKILTHIRCHMDDARIAVETGECSASVGGSNRR